MLALLLCLAVPDEASDLLKKVEDKAAAAASLRWKATAEIQDKQDKRVLVIEAAFQKGNRARVTGSSKPGSEPLSFTYTCDGTRVVSESSFQRRAESAEADPEVAAGLNRWLVIAGSVVLNHLKPNTPWGKLREAAKVKGHSVADETLDGRPAKRIAYAVEIESLQLTIDLWVDAKTLAPLRRDTAAEKPTHIRETFEDWVPDAELPDELFRHKP